MLASQAMEEADSAAKSSLDLNKTKNKVPHSDFKPLINKYVYSKWRASWSTTVNNKLYAIKSKLGDSLLSYRYVRREEAVLARCRIGHSRLTQSYMLNREKQPECVFCQEPLQLNISLLVVLALLLQGKLILQLIQLFNTGIDICARRKLYLWSHRSFTFNSFPSVKSWRATRMCFLPRTFSS